VNKFFRFSLVSGVGWCLDFFLYVTLINALNIIPGYANFFSSLVAITYVWFSAIGMIFYQKKNSKSFYFLIYWAYQFLSISVYSFLVDLTILYLHVLSFESYAEIYSKVLLTPINLVTNFIFMRYLVKRMSKLRKE